MPRKGKQLRIISLAIFLVWSCPISGKSIPFLCDGPYKGHTPTKDELARILNNHRDWVTAGKPFPDLRQANFCEADLRGLPLSGAELSGADLRGVILTGADLSAGTWNWDDVSDAQGKHFLVYREGKPKPIDLSSADLRGAHLDSVNFKAGNLRGVDLRGADLSNADLTDADMSNANLSSLHTGVQEPGGCSSDEKTGQLECFSSSTSTLWTTTLNGAIFSETTLSGADFRLADIDSARFEPKIGFLPDPLNIATAQNLANMTFKESPHALTILREDFKKLGLRKQERKLTFAIKHSERLNMEQPERAANWLAFEMTCKYGMSPARPVQIIGFLIMISSVAYMFAVRWPSRRGAIWAVWLSDRIDRNREERPTMVTADFPGHGLIIRWLRLAFIAAYFSVLSAFQMGWRELDIGSWISRVQPREYVLRGSGWVRTLAGVQSVISVYLLALSVLTYFGNPFE